MVNWELFKPRNFVIVGAIAAIAFYIFNHFSSKGNA